MTETRTTPPTRATRRRRGRRAEPLDSAVETPAFRRLRTWLRIAFGEPAALPIPVRAEAPARLSRQKD